MTSLDSLLAEWREVAGPYPERFKIVCCRSDLRTGLRESSDMYKAIESGESQIAGIVKRAEAGNRQVVFCAFEEEEPFLLVAKPGTRFW